jgi:hypothetical protein
MTGLRFRNGTGAGGIHFEQGDLDARQVGRQLADQAWTRALTYFDGSATN